jgi:hypothetical protein
MMRERYWNRAAQSGKMVIEPLQQELTMTQDQSSRMLSEMKDFATFTAAEQRYIRRSLDVGLNRRDATECWARHSAEAAKIAEQSKRYRMLDLIRACVPDDIALDETESFIGPLITMSAADLQEGKLTSFGAYRFLYERLIGPTVRPWLPSTFCAAAALPFLHPEQREQLLQSIKSHDATAPGWSSREPAFYPEWVEKVPESVS